MRGFVRMSADIESVSTEGRPESSQLGELNQRFHRYFASAQRAAHDRIENGDVPVVLRLDDRLVLAHGSRTTVAVINGAEYHMLKALAHLPMLAFLDSARADSLGAEALAAIVNDHAGLLARRSVDAAAFGECLQQLVAGNRDTSEQTSLSAIQQQLIALAAEDEVARLREICDQIQQELSEAGRWNVTHFVVSGGNQPRYKNLSKSFFKRLLSEQAGADEAAIHRVIYSETCDSLADAKDLVADRLANGALADVFLDSPISLDSDVLGDAGCEAIDRAFANAPCGSRA